MKPQFSPFEEDEPPLMRKVTARRDTIINLQSELKNILHTAMKDAGELLSFDSDSELALSPAALNLVAHASEVEPELHRLATLISNEQADIRDQNAIIAVINDQLLGLEKKE